MTIQTATSQFNLTSEDSEQNGSFNPNNLEPISFSVISTKILELMDNNGFSTEIPMEESFMKNEIESILKKNLVGNLNVKIA